MREPLTARIVMGDKNERVSVLQRCAKSATAFIFASAVTASLLFAATAPCTLRAQDASNEQGKAPPVRRSGSFPGLEAAGSVPAREKKSSPGSRAALKPSASKSTATAKAATHELVLLEVEKPVELRTVPAAQAPAIGQALAAGTLLVRLGKDAYGFTPVGLLGGFEGYVHRGFFRPLAAAEAENAWGETTGTDVSFRVQPRSGVPPLWAMPKRGTTMAILGRDGDWFHVLSAPSVRAWLPSQALAKKAVLAERAIDLDDGRSLVGANLSSHPRIAKQLTAQVDKLMAVWKLQREKAALAVSQQKAEAGIEAEFTQLAKDFDALRGEQEPRPAVFKPLRARQRKLEAAVQAAGLGAANIAARIKALGSEIERRGLIAEAKMAIKDPGMAAKNAVARKGASSAAAAKAERERLALVARNKERSARRAWTRAGWIEYRPGASDYSPYRLMKGGRTIAYVECKSGRYDLSDFRGREVGLQGKLFRPENADLKVLDIDRLVILASSR